MGEPGCRLIHTADLHLGARSLLFADAAEQVREARRHFVRQLPELARRHGAHGVLIAGDLFDAPAAVREEGKYVRECLEALAADGRFAVLTPGTHDAEVALAELGPAEVLDRADFAGVRSVEAAGRRLHFHGGAYDPLYSPADFLAALGSSREPGLHVAVLHAALLSDPGRAEPRELPVTAEQLAQLGCQYVALGHYHNLRRVEVDGRLVGAYPGTPVPCRFKETGPRRVLLVEVTAEGATAQPLTLSTPWTEQRRLEVTGAQDLEGLERRALEDFGGEEGASLLNLLLELTLIGTWELAPGGPEDLAERLRPRVAGLRLHDETHRLDAEWVAQLAAQRSPEGAFVRLLRERQAQAPEAEREVFERALVEVLSVVQEVRRR